MSERSPRSAGPAGADEPSYLRGEFRTLARDLGEALGSAGHLTALRRTRVGPFTLDEAVVLPEPGPDAACC